VSTQKVIRDKLRLRNQHMSTPDPQQGLRCKPTSLATWNDKLLMT